MLKFAQWTPTLGVKERHRGLLGQDHLFQKWRLWTEFLFIFLHKTLQCPIDLTPKKAKFSQPFTASSQEISMVHSQEFPTLVLSQFSAACSQEFSTICSQEFPTICFQEFSTICSQEFSAEFST